MTIVVNLILTGCFFYKETCCIKLSLVWFLSLLNGISTFVDYLMPKVPLLKNSRDTVKPVTADRGIRGSCLFPGALIRK